MPTVKIRVDVEFEELEEERKRLKTAAYAFDPAGRPLARADVDMEKGQADLKVEATTPYLVVKVGPVVEDLRRLEKLQPMTQTVEIRDERSIKVAFHLPRPIWICWLKVPYTVTGTVETSDGSPICAGEVDVYDVDIEYCIRRLPLPILENLREAILDVILDPPPIRLKEVPGLPGWWAEEWKQPPPDMPATGRLRVDVRKKLESLPAEWAFARARFEGLSTARRRMDAVLEGMTPMEKRQWLNQEAVEGVKVAKILYSNSAQFKELLLADFQAFRFWLCWYPWIYWLWWPWCAYSLEKLGTATLQPDGSFSLTVPLSICRRDTPDLWFVIRQTIGGVERVIYARHPVPCNTYWNHPSGHPVHLVVTDPLAVACHKPKPVTTVKPYVMPMGIYKDEWYEVQQAHRKPPDPIDAQRGLYQGTDPYGTRLDLRMQFDPRLHTDPGMDVRYYRWSYQREGDPSWTFIDTPIIHRFLDTQAGKYVIDTHKLGPTPVGTESNLFEIPDPGKSWLDNRNDLAYAIWLTDDLPDGKYTLRLEMFDSTGTKVTPAGAGFVYTLMTAPVGPVDDALHVEADGSILFSLHVDNQDTVADIQSVGLGAAPVTDCQFLEYANTNQEVVVTYVADHPNGFLESYGLTITRGISGTQMGSTSSSVAASSPTQFKKKVVDLLGQVGTKGPYTRCAFAVNLHTYPRTRNGHGTIRAYEDHDTAAFALVAAP